MILVIALLVVVAALAFVLYPLLRQRFAAEPATDPYSPSTAHPWLSEERQAAYEALTELEFDRDLSKLSEEDYRKLYERYRRNAVAVLKSESEHEAEVSSRIEREVSELRMTERSDPVDSSSTSQERRCPACGAEVTLQAAYCSSCGLNLRAVEERASAPSAEPEERSPDTSSTQPRPALQRDSGRVSRRAKLWLAGLLGVTLLGLVVISILFVQGSSRALAEPVGTIQGNGVYSTAIITSNGPLAAGTDGTLMRSADGGHTWRKLASLKGNVSALAEDPRDPNHLYAVVSGALEESTDGGKTWLAGGPLPGKAKVQALAVDPNASGGLYAVDDNGTLYTSSDAGAHWKAIGQHAPSGLTSLTVASTKPLVLFGSVPGLGAFRSDGDSWGVADGFVNGALPTQKVHQVVFDPFTGEGGPLPGGGEAHGTLYAATDQGIFKSVDYGGSWSRMGLKVDTVSVALGARDSNLMIAIDSDNNVYRSTNRGVSWVNS